MKTKDGRHVLFAYNNIADGEKVTQWHETLEDADAEVNAMHGLDVFASEHFEQYGSKYILLIEDEQNIR